VLSTGLWSVLPVLGGGSTRFIASRQREDKTLNALSYLVKNERPAVQPSQESPDLMGDLKKLGELHDAGVVADDKFNTKKAGLLAKM